MSTRRGPTGEPQPWYDPAGVREVARRAVRRCAASEADLFDLVADEFFARGSVSPVGAARRGARVGSGPDPGGGLISAGALTVATLAAAGAVEAFGGTGGRVAGWWRKRRPVPTDPNAAVPAPGDRAAALVGLVEVARRAGLSEAQARQLATAVLTEVPARGQLG